MVDPGSSPLEVSANNAFPISSGDLGIREVEGVFYVHPDVVNTLAEIGVRRNPSALTVYSHLLTFPSAFQERLNWDKSQIDCCKQLLFEGLKKYIPEDYLKPNFQRGFGAR